MRRVIPGLDALDERLEGEIRPRLDGVEDVLAKAVEADSDVLGTTAGYLLAAGGKRFRPTLVLLAGYFGDPTDPRLIRGAAAIELTHVATLYHDDVMDEAASRHGVPSVNARWDNTIAILTGDFLFARSSELAADLGPDVCRLLAQTIAILCEAFRETAVLAQAKMASVVPIVSQIHERSAGFSVGLIKQAMSNPRVIQTPIVESATHSTVDNVPSQR